MLERGSSPLPTLQPLHLRGILYWCPVHDDVHSALFAAEYGHIPLSDSLSHIDKKVQQILIAEEQVRQVFQTRREAHD